MVINWLNPYPGIGNEADMLKNIGGKVADGKRQ
jgi:hypothetical protein